MNPNLGILKAFVVEHLGGGGRFYSAVDDLEGLRGIDMPIFPAKPEPSVDVVGAIF